MRCTQKESPFPYRLWILSDTKVTLKINRLLEFSNFVETSKKSSSLVGEIVLVSVTSVNPKYQRKALFDFAGSPTSHLLK